MRPAASHLNQYLQPAKGAPIYVLAVSVMRMIVVVIMVVERRHGYGLV